MHWQGLSLAVHIVLSVYMKFYLLGILNKVASCFKSKFSFSAKLLLAFGFVFELPLVITFLARIGLVTVDFLKTNRKYAILLFFITSAILTPPDVVTQVMMSVPLMILYEISIIGARIFGKKTLRNTVNNL